MSALFFPTAILIDNQPLTDQGREPINIARVEKSTIVETATGKKRKYVKAIKKTFSTRWNWLPDQEGDTIDGGMGRVKMLNLLCDDMAQIHVLRLYDRNGGYREYNVFVSSYTETLIRRDPHTGMHIWMVDVQFEEQ